MSPARIPPNRPTFKSDDTPETTPGPKFLDHDRISAARLKPSLSVRQLGISTRVHANISKLRRRCNVKFAELQQSLRAYSGTAVRRSPAVTIIIGIDDISPTVTHSDCHSRRQ